MHISLNRSLGWGLALALLATVATLIVGFIVGAGFNIPGIMEMSSASSDNKPTTEFFFNPLAPLMLAVVLGLVIWSVGRARNPRED